MLIFYYGSNSFLINRRVIAAIEKLAPNDFDFSRYEGENDRIITDLRTPPFFGDRRVVSWFVPKLEGTEAPLSSLIFDALEALESSPKTTLILAVGSSPAKNLKTFKTVKSAADEAEEFIAIAPWDRRAQIKQIAAITDPKKFRKITHRLHEALAEQFANDLARADAELSKIANAYNPQELTDKTAIECLSDGEAASVFDLTDALLDGNYGKAVRLAKRLEDAHEPALKVLATITNKFHGVFSVLIGAESPGISPAQARFFKNRYYGQAERILRALAILKLTTIQIKSGSPQWSELLIAIYKVCNA
jgi:DNA polymerase-3 subunit delta